MMRISEYLFEQQAEGKWVASASDLGLPAGSWPEAFAVVPVVGKDIVFRKAGQLPSGSYRYVDAQEQAICVLNA